MSGSQASSAVGVSLSCGSKWFVDARGMTFIDKPINRRFMDQGDRIEFADGLSQGEPAKQADGELCRVAADKLAQRWPPAQISRWFRRRWPHRPHWYLCHEAAHEAAYQGHLPVAVPEVLRAGRVYRRKRARGRSRQGAFCQLTNLRSIHERPASVNSRRYIGHWEFQCCCQVTKCRFVVSLIRYLMPLALRGCTHHRFCCGAAWPRFFPRPGLIQYQRSPN